MKTIFIVDTAKRRRTHEEVQAGRDLGTYSCWFGVVDYISPVVCAWFGWLEASCGGILDAAGDGDAVAVDGADGASRKDNDSCTRHYDPMEYVDVKAKIT